MPAAWRRYRPNARPNHHLNYSLRRSLAWRDGPALGAKPGDRVVVTGTIGDAALGLLLRRDPATPERWDLNRRQQDHLRRAIFFLSRVRRLPTCSARMRPRRWMSPMALRGSRKTLPGFRRLGGDRCRECALVGCSPCSLREEPALIETILTGGDDYEVLATLPAAAVELFAELHRRRMSW